VPPSPFPRNNLVIVMRILATLVGSVSILLLLACAGPTPVAPEPSPVDHVDAPPVERVDPPDSMPPTDTPLVASVAARMTLANGFQMAGSLRSITDDGLVRLTSPLFDGEHAVRLNMLDRIQLGASLPGAGQVVLMLTTGDTLRGDVETITEDSVLFHSASLGTMNLPKSALANIRWVGKASALLVTDFSTGRLGL